MKLFWKKHCQNPEPNPAQEQWVDLDLSALPQAEPPRPTPQETALAAAVEEQQERNRALCAELAEQRRVAFRQAVQSTLLAFTALVAVVAVCIAWFVNNSRVSGSSVAVQTAGPRFSLASMGTLGRFDTDDSMKNNLGTEKTIDGKTYYLSSGSIVTWMTGDDSNLRNESGGTDILEPGAAGSITFYIIPEVDDLGSVKIDLTMTPYKVVETVAQTQARNDNYLTVNRAAQAGEIVGDKTLAAETPVTDLLSPLDPLNESEAAVCSLMKGHLLFFKTCETVDATGHQTVKYSGWLKEDTVELKPANGSSYFTKDKPFEVKLYWIWPMQFSSYVTTTKSPQLFDRTTDSGGESETSEWDLFAEEIKSDEGVNKYLGGINVPTDRTNLAQALDSTNPNALTPWLASYNDGDEMIGRNVRYTLLKIEATETTTQAEG